jgi:hypothetical protein
MGGQDGYGSTGIESGGVLMKDFRTRLDDLETAAWCAWRDAVRAEDATEPELRLVFYFIEKLISQYDKDAAP